MRQATQPETRRAFPGDSRADGRLYSKAKASPMIEKSACCRFSLQTKAVKIGPPNVEEKIMTAGVQRA